MYRRKLHTINGKQQEKSKYHDQYDLDGDSDWSNEVFEHNMQPYTFSKPGLVSIWDRPAQDENDMLSDTEFPVLHSNTAQKSI